MLRTDLTDHRNTDDARLVQAVAEGDAIALAEAYHRTITAAHACARRLLASPVEVEALLRSVYAELWEEPPIDEALEGWVRQRSFALGTGYLRQRGLKAASSSLAAWTSGVDADERHGASDPLEQMIGELQDEQQAALVRAHDQGIRTSDQDDDGAGEALKHALLVLASPLSDAERHAAEMCTSGVALANWIFGLLPPHEAATVPGTAAEPTPCGRLAGVLRRARRRFEPLPPTPDMGHRVLAWVLSNSQPRGPHHLQPSSLDAGLRVASADLDRGAEERGGATTRSSLDMDLPASQPAEVQQPPVTALRHDPGASPSGWARPEPESDERETDDERARPLRRPASPSGFSASGATPIAFGSTAPALTPQPAEPVADDEEDLVRMPLQRSGRPALSPTRDERPAPADDESRRPTEPEADETLPPRALRRAPDESKASPAMSETAPNPLVRPAQSPLGTPADDTSPAPSPLPDRGDEGAATRRDRSADSPLRRPAPSRQQDADTQQHPLAGAPGTAPAPGTEPAQREAFPQDQQPAPSVDDDATVQTPIQRDDSDPRVDELFGGPGGGGPTGQQGTGGTQAANLTAPTLPAARRPTPPPPTGRPVGRPASAGAASRAERRPAAPSRPMPTVEPEPEGGSNIVRWLVVILLIAAGAAVGIFLGQMLI